MRKKVIAVLATAVGSALLALVPAKPASAAWIQFVYNYHSYAYAADHPGACRKGLGSYASFSADDKDLANNNFASVCPVADGGGVVVKNNAASAVNYNNQRLRVYYNSYAVMGCWCGSTYYTFPADTSVGNYGEARDLPEPMKNDNASHHILP